MKTLDPILKNAMENQQGETIIRVNTWLDLAAYNATPTIPETTWNVKKFDIFATSATAVIIGDNDYNKTNFTVFIIDRGIRVNGIEYIEQSGLFFLTAINEFPGIIFIEGSSYPKIKISIAGDDTYENVINAFCTAIGKTANYKSNASDGFREAQFFPTGKQLNLNKAALFENLLKQKYTILVCEIAPKQLLFYSPNSLATTQDYAIAWSPELNLAMVVAQTGTGARGKSSPDGINWTPQDNLNKTISWQAITWSPELGLFAAVGQVGSCATSTDGITWTSRVAPVKKWESICWSPELSLFVAVQSNTAGDKVMTSSDGITWNSITAQDSNWKDVCWSPKLNLFVAVSSLGQTMRSTDGSTWIMTSAGATNRAICWSPELEIFVMVTESGTDRAYHSTDGINWTPHTTETNNWNSVTWSPELNLFAAVSSDGTNRVMTSSNGTTWTPRTTPVQIAWLDVIWAPEISLFIAVSTNGGNNSIMTSPNGINWASRVTNNDFNLSFESGPKFSITHGLDEVHFIWRDIAGTINTTGDTTKPQWNLGFFDSVQFSIPAIKSDPYYKFDIQVAPVHLDITDGDKVHFEPYFEVDPTKVIDAMVWVTEHFDTSKTPAWWQEVKSITIFNSTEGGALPSTIERIAAYTPLVSTGFNGNLTPSINNLQALAEAVDDLTLGGSIPILATDPVSPTDGQLWMLRKVLGSHANGEAMGMLGMTYTGNTGTISPLQLSVNDNGTTRRLQFT